MSKLKKLIRRITWMRCWPWGMRITQEDLLESLWQFEAGIRGMRK